MQVYWRVTEEKQKECEYKGKDAEVCAISFKTELNFYFEGEDKALKDDSLLKVVYCPVQFISVHL